MNHSSQINHVGEREGESRQKDFYQFPIIIQSILVMGENSQIIGQVPSQNEWTKHQPSDGEIKLIFSFFPSMCAGLPRKQ